MFICIDCRCDVPWHANKILYIFYLKRRQSEWYCFEFCNAMKFKESWYDLFIAYDLNTRIYAGRSMDTPEPGLILVEPSSSFPCPSQSTYEILFYDKIQENTDKCTTL
jgi:hypothetical protein